VLQGDEKARSRSRGFGSPGGSIASTEKLVHRKEDVGLSCFVGLHSRKLSESRRWESVYSLPNMETSFFQSRGLTADKTSSNRKSHRHLSPEILSAGMSYQQELFSGSGGNFPRESQPYRRSPSNHRSEGYPAPDSRSPTAEFG